MLGGKISNHDSEEVEDELEELEREVAGIGREGMVDAPEVVGVESLPDAPRQVPFKKKAPVKTMQLMRVEDQEEGESVSKKTPEPLLA